MNAQQIATLAHTGQFRRDGVTPYINHPAAVASFFLEGGPTQSVAWLHDVIEDTEMTPSDLRDLGVSASVVASLRLLTHKKGEPYMDYIKRIWEGYGIVGAMARRVKFADMMVNLADDPTPRQKEKYLKALKYIARMI